MHLRAGNVRSLSRRRAANGVSRLDSTADWGSSNGSLVFDSGDLDLVVTDSNGNVVCYSASYDSSWEICDFPAVPAVTYTARVAKAATPQPGTYLGIAWQNYSALAE